MTLLKKKRPLLRIDQKPSIVFVVVLTVLSFLFFDKTKETLEVMFVKELQYNSGVMTDEDQLFSGRGSLIKEYLNLFNKGTFIDKVLGIQKNSGRTHNEFLRILILSGYLGLFFYILFYINIFKKFLKHFAKRRKIFFLSLWRVLITLIDALSVTWGLYPYYLLIFPGFLIYTLKYNNQNF